MTIQREATIISRMHRHIAGFVLFATLALAPAGESALPVPTLAEAVAAATPPHRKVSAIEKNDRLIADFEGETYGDWKTTGDAFGSGPAHGTLPGQMQVDGYDGNGLVNSFHNGDGATGTLISPPFKIERKFIAFLIGGGKDAAKTCMNLRVAGRAVRNATGPNDKPGGSEQLESTAWDVGEFIGQTAVIEIMDHATGGWGHINVDRIVQTDRKPAGMLSTARIDVKITAKYLHLPIKNGVPVRKFTLFVDGKPEVVNDIELADTAPDWWAFMDVSAWRGKVVTLQVEKLRDDSMALKSIDQGDTIKGAEDLYREPLRGQFHFSSRRGWINDPNGMAFFNGEYHLFYQHNPYGIGWGNMHWGHATSRDMVHWREWGDTLAPDAFGPMFSGSGVVDWKNNSGFGRDGHPPLVLIYTAAGNPTVQCMAYSLDGRRLTKFNANPVVKQITAGNRDPKVFWHEPTRKWCMVLYVGMNNKHTVHILTSPNLREWTMASVVLGGTEPDNFLFECPDFFELPVDGDARNTKWVLMAANAEYATGAFDGTTFTPEQVKLPGHLGKNFYAAQTFSDTPDKRRIQMGWFQLGGQGPAFHNSMTLPQELKLTATPEGPRLTRAPIKELAALRSRTHRFDSLMLHTNDTKPLARVKAELVELEAEFTPGNNSVVAFDVRGAVIVYDAKAQELIVNGQRAPAPLRDGKQRLTVFCDRVGLEVFASDGLTYVPSAFQPRADNLSLGVQVKTGSAQIERLRVYELKSAWSRP